MHRHPTRSANFGRHSSNVKIKLCVTNWNRDLLVIIIDEYLEINNCVKKIIIMIHKVNHNQQEDINNEDLFLKHFFLPTVACKSSPI